MSAKTESWTGQMAVRLPARDLWDLMWRRRGQRQWLGPEAFVGFDPHVRSVLADDAGVWRTAYVVRHKVPASGTAEASRSGSGSVTFDVAPPASWWSSGPTRLVIALASDEYEDNETLLTIEESGIPAGRRDEVKRFWLACMDRLAHAVHRVRERRRDVRQAVVVIHGIGEQQPGDTLESLVKSGVLSDAGDHKDLWVKPDRFSDLYELRRVTIKASETRPATDVFELYWAHVIRDTTLNHIATWVQRVLFRRKVPRPILPLWLVLWASMLIAVGVTAASLFGEGAVDRVAQASVLTALAAFVWRMLGRPFLLNFVGDAARYMRPHPENIAHRQAIRQAGVELLEKLHASARYDRIVIVGHSLGSVIAYDIVTHAWMRFNTSHERPSQASFKELRAVERALFDGTPADTVQDRQHAAWRRQRINTQPWLVTDLVTLGSPLTYADFLLGKNAGAFEQSKADRVLPTCPPTTEVEVHTGQRRMTFEVPYTDPFTSSSRTFVYFHHGAPFAVTRWTNLYFVTRRLGLVGDLIGGPVGSQLGGWIKDVPLKPPRNGFTHTWYWRRSRRRDVHLTELREALRLDAREALLNLSAELPAFALVGRANERPRGSSVP